MPRSTYSQVALLAIFCIVSPALPNARGEEKPAAASQTQSFLVGPLLLGDFYAKDRGQAKLIEVFGAANAPAEEDVIKALNRCQFYVSDQSELSKLGFPQCSHLPDVLVRGDLRFVVANRQGQELTLHLTKAERLDTHTEVFNDSSKSWRQVRFVMRWVLTMKGGKETDETSWNLSGKKFVVTYDVQGKSMEPPSGLGIGN
jgi:hypothetical protein